MPKTISVVYKVFICFSLFACNDKVPQSQEISGVSEERSDTATLVRLAIRTAIYHGNLPGIEAVIKNDSVFVTSDSSYFQFIPRVLDTLNFKIVSQSEICSLLSKDSSRNYLYIRALERIDSSYYISIQNLNCKPYGGGGAIGIYLSKINDSIVVKSHTSSSIN